MSRRLRRTEIVATLGPATDCDSDLEKAIAAGANVVRMNFSYGTLEDHQLRVDRTREIATELDRHMVILGDPRGPKIRVSTFKEGKIFLNVSDKFLLDANPSKGEGDKEKVRIDYKGPSADVVPSDTLLLDNGRVQPKVLEIQGMKVFTEATVGGPLSNNKGISKLGGGLSAETLTDKDRADIVTAARIGVDYLTVSFPRRGEDLNHARRLARDAGCDVKIVARVERVKAVCGQDMMDGVVLTPDVVTAVRGDLDVEIDDPELVDIQKVLIRRTHRLNRSAITAIQVTKPMITNPMPTRAEVADVANTVPDGTDAVMLSMEAVTGQYPSETVTTMAHVCLGAKKIPSPNVSKHRLGIQFDNMEEVIATSTMCIADHLEGVTVIIAMTRSGRTALMTSRIGSGLSIFVFSRHERTPNLTALYCGVTSVFFDSQNDGVVAAHDVANLLRDEGYLVSGDLVAVTQGDMISTIGSTNTTRILTVE